MAILIQPRDLRAMVRGWTPGMTPRYNSLPRQKKFRHDNTDPQKPARKFNLDLSVTIEFSIMVYNLWVFRDEDVGAKCETQCELEYVDCTLSYSDTNCLIDCGRALTDCVQGLFKVQYDQCPCRVKN